jgi:hypothetical protein
VLVFNVFVFICWEASIEMDIQEIRPEGVDRIYLAQDRTGGGL